MTAITGNTYPIRRELREMGGEWDAAKKAWFVPDERAGEAKALLGTGQARHNASRRPSRYSGGVSNYARFSSGAVVYTNKRGRCIDAPCCGCCS